MALSRLRRAWEASSSRLRIVVGVAVSLYVLHIGLLLGLYVRLQPPAVGLAPLGIFNPYRGLLLFQTPSWIVILLFIPGVVLGCIASLVSIVDSDSERGTRPRTLLLSVGTVVTMFAISILSGTFAVLAFHVASAASPEAAGDRSGVFFAELLIGNIAAIIFFIVGVWSLINLGIVLLISLFIGWGIGELLRQLWD